MAGIKPETSYSLLGFAWTTLVVGSVAVIYTGAAEPTIAASALPSSVAVTGGVAAALVVVGWLLVARRLAGLWKDAGRSAGLDPGGGSLLSALGIGSKPDLTGAVGGRDVRIHTESRKSGDGSEGGSKYTTYTVVETELAQQPEEGVAIVRQQPGEASADGVDLGNVSIDAVAIDDDFAALGDESALAEAVVSSTARDHLRALDPGTILFVGDATDTILDAMPEMPKDSFFGGMATDALTAALPTNPGTVALQTKGTTLDGDVLRRRAESVVAAADGFESATGNGRS